TRSKRDWSSDVCSSDLRRIVPGNCDRSWEVTVSRRGRRGGLAGLLASALALTLAACATPLPNSVVAGSSTTIGWTHRLTSTNAASTDGATAGNLGVAALTRGQFAVAVEGAAVIDESFGTATITNPETFTVRYDLAEPAWSDGIPVDAADLMLAWAAGSNALTTPEEAVQDADGKGDDPGADDEPADDEPADDGPTVQFDSVPTGLTASEQITDYDQFGRWIEVRFAHPVIDWQTALDVAVPAHVAGELAFGIEDPMEVKQAVIDAITDADVEDLAALAEAWNSGFVLQIGRASCRERVLDTRAAAEKKSKRIERL